MNRQMGTINDLIDELGKSTDKWGISNMSESELAKLCYNATITILELQDDVKLLKRMWYHAHSEAQNFKVENTKLRKLCADAWYLFTERDAVNPYDLSIVDAVRDQMRELGVEID